MHPLAPVNFDTQIPKKGDQRQMEEWQRIGTYAAGLALDSAGVKGKAEILSHMDMIVAAGGGERDVTVDSTILSGMPRAPNPGGFLNERLMSDLRPTLFLAQLSNLLAGNISIVHGVTGSSRTFMGEEAAGVDAVRIALSRIASGQSDIALVGGAHNAERPDMLMLYEFGRFNLKDRFAPVWQRGDAPRLCARLARRLSGDRGARPRGEARRQAAGAAHRRALRPFAAQARRRHQATLERLWDKLKSTRAAGPGRDPLRRDRRRAGDRRGAGLSRGPWRPCRARHRVLSRSWGGAAIRHERGAGCDRARSW